MCGLFGIHGHKEASRLGYLGLYALQHRGEESAGLYVHDRNNSKCKIRSHKGMGLVGDVFDEKAIESLTGDIAVGHVRYSTTGSSHAANVQPFLAKHKRGHIAIAHNGNLTNTKSLHNELEEKGSVFQTTMDSEIIAHLLVRADKRDPKSRITSALSSLNGAYSLVIMMDKTLIGARDPYGFRPLCIGKVDGSYVLTSETCVLDLIQAEYIRDVEPGEIVLIDDNGLTSIKPFTQKKSAMCIFEFIYFARPDSNIFNHNVYKTRKKLGKKLAQECPANCDIAMPIPDSGSHAAVGFTEESGIPHEIGMIRNHYVGRTFIQPSQFIRDFRVKVKLNPVKAVLKDKRLAVIEDSIVRGTTSRVRVRTLREAGGKEVHMRVSCPPIKYPCFFGIDFPTREELIGANKTVEEIRDFIGLDSLKYLSLEGMLKAMPLPKDNFCTACFSGKYPVEPPEDLNKNVLE